MTTPVKSTTPDLSAVFAGLTIEPSAEPLPASTRGSLAGPNPFTKPLLASIEHNTPYSFMVPANAVQRAVFLINAAAKKADKGVRIVTDVQRDNKGQIMKKNGKVTYNTDKAGNVLIRFQGKAERKKQTAPRPYSIIPGKDGKPYRLRDRATKQDVMTGTKEQVKAEYDKRKAAAIAATATTTTTATTEQPAA